MKKTRKIVYLCTESNAKCFLGLKEILVDGWNVTLVIAYKPSTENARNSSFKHQLKGSIKTLLHKQPTLYLFLRKLTSREIVQNFNIEKLCSDYCIPYKSTSEKSLLSMMSDMTNIAPDVILSNGWQFKISNEIISMARLIALNCHSSYLPEYRGGNVTFAPLINEETETGVTVHQLVDKFDAGAILAQERVTIQSGETPQSLNMKRAAITGRVLIDALEIAGHPELYKSNPPSPFYFRCNYATFRRFKRINRIRKLIGLPIMRYEPKERYDI
jgi:methionyl-tRNA formyltransferase